MRQIVTRSFSSQHLLANMLPWECSFESVTVLRPPCQPCMSLTYSRVTISETIDERSRWTERERENRGRDREKKCVSVCDVRLESAVRRSTHCQSFTALTSLYIYERTESLAFYSLQGSCECVSSVFQTFQKYMNHKEVGGRKEGFRVSPSLFSAAMILCLKNPFSAFALCPCALKPGEKKKKKEIFEAWFVFA